MIDRNDTAKQRTRRARVGPLASHIEHARRYHPDDRVMAFLRSL
jgi:hypothetical protein